MKKIMNLHKFLTRMQFIYVIVLLLTTFMISSCSKDDNDGPSNGNQLVGKWVTTTMNYKEDRVKSVKIILKFNSDNTGSIAEDWEYDLDLEEPVRKSYLMKFRWTTKADDNTLTIDYVSGDRHTELFDGDYTITHWTRKYAVAGTTLHLFPWTLHKK